MKYESGFINYWVEPDGTVHTGYGLGWHSEFAIQWVKDNIKDDEEVYKHNSDHVEYMEEVCKWVRYCGWYGKGVWAVDPDRRLTKAQRETMYDLTKYK